MDLKNSRSNHNQITNTTKEEKPRKKKQIKEGDTKTQVKRSQVEILDCIP